MPRSPENGHAMFQQREEFPVWKKPGFLFVRGLSGREGFAVFSAALELLSLEYLK